MIDKKIEILRLLHLGYKSAYITKELGCTKQYVSFVKIQYGNRWTKGQILVTKVKSGGKVPVSVYNVARPSGGVEDVDRKLVLGMTGRDRNRELVRLRDNHTCQNCRKKWVSGRRFDVHHVNGMCGKKSLGYDSIKDCVNLITLCHRCHYNHYQHTLITSLYTGI